MFTACGITQSSAPEDGRNYRPKQVELIEIINKPLLLHLVGYLYNWQMGFNSVFKGLINPKSRCSSNRVSVVVMSCSVLPH